MAKIYISLVCIIFLSACQKKDRVESIPQRPDNFVPSTSLMEIDTTQTYISTSDALSDRSIFDAENFQTKKIQYRGERTVSYFISSPLGSNKNVMFVLEYLGGTKTNGDTTSTASRILIYTDNALAYRKAFPLEFSGTKNFFSILSFNHSFFSVSQTKSIMYYWLEIERGGKIENEYHSISIDTEGIVNELTGNITRIGANVETVRFLNENRMRARVTPSSRYPNLKIDLYFSIDWKLCSALLDVPVDTIFTVSEQPSRYFSNKIKLFGAPNRRTTFRETNFRRLTQAQMQRIFIPSYFNPANIDRDFIFIEFNRTNRGWIDYETMLFEEIISER